MNGGSSRRTFFKKVLSLSALGAASAVSFTRDHPDPRQAFATIIFSTSLVPS